MHWKKGLKKRLFSSDTYDQRIPFSLECRDAIALVCLDDPLKDVHLPWESVAAHQLLDGGIDGVNAGNRWCDKTIQLIVG